MSGTELALPGCMTSSLGETVEEIANVATHGFGLLVSLLALPIFIFIAARTGDPAVTVGVTIFGLTLIGAYAASTMYHSVAAGPRKEYWRRLDQGAVYLLIAGTYTPFSLGALRGPWGWALLGSVWFAAFVGIAIKVGFRVERPTLETVTYLAMGWLVVIAFQPLVASIGWAGVAWILAGGLAYTVGTVFLVNQSRIRFGHCAWHVFVLGGSACHVVAVMNYGLNAAR